MNTSIPFLVSILLLSLPFKIAFAQEITPSLKESSETRRMVRDSPTESSFTSQFADVSIQNAKVKLDMYRLGLRTRAISAFSYVSPLELQEDDYYLLSTSFHSPLQDERKSSPLKTILFWTGVGAGVGGGVGLLVDVAEAAGNCQPGSPCDDDRSYLLLGTLLGGSAGALMGLSQTILESESPSLIERSIAGGMIGLVMGSVAGAALGIAAESSANEEVQSGEETSYCIDHDCTRLWATVLGGVGTVAGVVLGIVGEKKDDARRNGVDVGLYPHRSNGFAVQALVRF